MTGPIGFRLGYPLKFDRLQNQLPDAVISQHLPESGVPLQHIQWGGLQMRMLPTGRVGSHYSGQQVPAKQCRTGQPRPW